MAPDKDVEQKGELGAQIFQLQGLVGQMKEGFIQAMTELSLIQDGDRRLQRQVEKNREESDKKIEALTESVQKIQTNLAAVLAEVQRNSKTTEKLSQQCEGLRREQGRVRRKLKQNEDKPENERQHQRKKSIPLSSKSDSGNNTNNSSSYNTVTVSDSSMRRRKSTPAAIAGLADGDRRSPAIKESRPKMAPMMMSFLDSLPDANDLNKNESIDVGFDLPNGIPGRQITPRAKSNSPVSSDTDPVEMEQMMKQSLHSGIRRVSFSNLDQMHDSVDNNEGQRLQLAEDFLLSERKYVGQLNALLENIMLPLVTESLIHASDISLIFPPCLAKMFDRHCCLLCALETRLSDAKWQGMHGDIFAKFAGVESANFVSQYGSYIGMFPESLSLLSHHTRKSAKLTKFLKKQLADIEDEQADLLGYLLAPIQRIPAYVLHLQTVLEHTTLDHPDYFHVESCLTHLGHFLADMNPAIKEAVEAARTHKLFLSERSASAPKNQALSSFRSSPEDEGMLDDSMDGFHATWNGSPSRQQTLNMKVLTNGYKRDRRASFPDFDPLDRRRMVLRGNVGGTSQQRAIQGRRAGAGIRRGSYDHCMLSEAYRGMAGHDRLSGGIPGMMYIPEQGSTESVNRPPDGRADRHGRKSARARDSPAELPRYGIYGENDTDVEVLYEPSSPSSKQPGARRTGTNQQQGPRHKRQFSSPASADLSSGASTPRDNQYLNGSPRGQIIFDESEVHPQPRDRARSASGSKEPPKLEGPSSEGKGSSTLHLQQPTKSQKESRKRAHSVSHLNRIGMPQSTKPSPLKDVWNESKEGVGSAEKLPTPRAKQKPSLKRPPKENPTPATKAAKKSHFLAGSLKNIFFGKGRKRESCVVELESDEIVNGSMGEHELAALKTDTYRDEDGQPCSNV